MSLFLVSQFFSYGFLRVKECYQLFLGQRAIAMWHHYLRKFSIVTSRRNCLFLLSASEHFYFSELYFSIFRSGTILFSAHYQRHPVRAVFQPEIRAGRHHFLLKLKYMPQIETLK